MSKLSERTFRVAPEQALQTLAALLRASLPGQSWSQVRKLIAGRRVQVNGEVWLDDARRMRDGDIVDILNRPAAVTDHVDQIPIRHIDEHIIVVEKPAGISTVRHPSERLWTFERRKLVPTLDDLVLHQTGAEYPKRGQGKLPRLRIVHRIDKETSGLVVFARTVKAESGLGKQFARHTVLRKYLAIASGQVATQTIRSTLVRDRGDGRRGSGSGPGKEAITHVEAVEKLPYHTLLSCRLETGRTHQIRIHLAESGHPVCGDRVYGKSSLQANEKAPRLALHASELGLAHPVTGEEMKWEMPLPPDLREFLEAVRKGG